ncbi:MAG: 7-cyano-7-deazaguanine synthase QueC [Alphaproteobacteria bacterium]
MKALAVVSGGLDSVTLAYVLASQNQLGGMVSFDYGQRHKKELVFAQKAAEKLKVPHHLIDLSSITKHLKGSALTDNIAVPDGHYAAENMKQTIVPNRNAIMLAVAYGIAPAHGYDAVAIAIHSGDHFIYPDCRPEFADLFDQMEQKAMEGFADIKLLTPFVGVTKGGIAEQAIALGVPLSETWSCYKGGDIHCGRCGTCVERREAFALAKAKDPTLYEDANYWKEALASREAR